MLSEAEFQIKTIVIDLIEGSPREQIMAGSPTAVITALREKGLMAPIDAIFDKMPPMSHRCRAEKLKRVINDALEFTGCYAKIKRAKPAKPAPQPIDQLDELLAQHS